MKVRFDYMATNAEILKHWTTPSGLPYVDKRFEHELNTPYLEVPLYEVLRE